jgi:2-dehydropantoate 2-reductase
MEYRGWFFDEFGGRYKGLRLMSIDPDGSIARTISSERVLGVVVHFSASTAEPGVVTSHAGRRLIVGEPDGSMSARLTTVAGALGEAGFEVDATAVIQNEIWYKLWGNMTMNPISALTGATTDLILGDELVEAFCTEVMREASIIGAEIGCPIRDNPDDRNDVTRRLGAFKTSMLQDVEAGKPLEIDVMLTAVREIAISACIPIPFTDALLGLSRLNARVRGLYPGSAM